MSVASILNRSTSCPESPSTPITDVEFAQGAANVVEPTCSDWSQGLSCNSELYVAKANWLWQRVTRALSSLEQEAIKIVWFGDEVKEQVFAKLYTNQVPLPSETGQTFFESWAPTPAKIPATATHAVISLKTSFVLNQVTNDVLKTYLGEAKIILGDVANDDSVTAVYTAVNDFSVPSFSTGVDQHVSRQSTQIVVPIGDLASMNLEIIADGLVTNDHMEVVVKAYISGYMRSTA